MKYTPIPLKNIKSKPSYEEYVKLRRELIETMWGDQIKNVIDVDGLA